MDEAVILMTQEGPKVFKKSNFQEPFIWNPKLGFLRKFNYGGNYYDYLIYTGDENHAYGDFAFYVKINEWREKRTIRKSYTEEKMIEDKIILNTDELIPGENGDFIVGEFIDASGKSVHKIQWQFNGSEFVDFPFNLPIPIDSNKKPILATGVKLLASREYFFYQVIEDFYNIHAGRVAAGGNIDPLIVGEIARIITEMDASVKAALDADNLLPNVYNTQQVIWSNESEGEFLSYSNADFIKYRDYLIWYQNWFNTLRDRLHDDSVAKDEKMFYLAHYFSSSALRVLSVQELLTILRKMAVIGINGYFHAQKLINKDYLIYEGQSIHKEYLALKIIDAVEISIPSDVNEFLEGLINITIEDNQPKTLFQALYEQIKDYESAGKHFFYEKDNLRYFNTKIYLLWLKSGFNPYFGGVYDQTILGKYTYNGFSPAKLDYHSTDYYFFKANNLNFEFYFDKNNFTNKIRVFRNKSYAMEKIEPRAMGIYHLYQPISIFHVQSESKVQAPPEETNCIPVFFLKYIDDASDEETFDQQIGLMVDIALTFVSGVGIFTKLKHLRDLSRLGKAVLAIDGVGFTVGVGHTLSTYFCNDGSTFCKNLQETLFWLELASLGPVIVGEIKVARELAETMAKKSAKKTKQSGYPPDFDGDAKQVVDDLAAKSGDDIIEFVEDIFDKIKKELKDKIERENYISPGRFNPSAYSNSELDDIIGHAYNDLFCNEDEIVGIIFNNSRIKKDQSPPTVNTIKSYFTNWIEVVTPNKYPYKFANINDFNTFKNKLKTLLEGHNIPTKDVRIQGSALYKTDAGDIDAVIFINEDESSKFVKIFLDNYKIKTKGLENKKYREYKDKLMTIINEEGVIRMNEFKFTSDITTLRDEFIAAGGMDTNLFEKNKFDLTLAIESRGVHNPPYLHLDLN